jgi:peptidylprolyl isomerase
MKPPVLAILVCCALLVGGCGDSDSSPKEAVASAGHATKVEGPPPKVAAQDHPPPKTLKVIDLRKGNGATAKPGDELTVQYIAVFHMTGAPLESSWEDGHTFTFKLSSGSVNQGWLRGLPGMKVGGRRKLFVPARLMFKHAASTDLGPDGAVIYVIDLLEANPPRVDTKNP